MTTSQTEKDRRDSSSVGITSRSSTDDGSENDNHSDFHGAIRSSAASEVVPTSTEISRDVEIGNSPTNTSPSSIEGGSDVASSEPSLPPFLDWLRRRDTTNHNATQPSLTMMHPQQVNQNDDIENNGHTSVITTAETDDNDNQQFAWPSLGRATQLMEADDHVVAKDVIDDDHTISTTTEEEEESFSSNDISFESQPPMLYRLLENVDYFSSIDEASVCSCPTVATDDEGDDDDDDDEDIVCGISIDDAKPIFERRPRKKQLMSLFNPDEDVEDNMTSPSKLSWCQISGLSLLFASGGVLAIKFL